MRLPSNGWIRSRRAGLMLASLAAAGLLGCSSPKPAAAPRAAHSALSTSRDREQISVTVYNQDLGLIRERRSIALGSGLVALTFEDVAQKIQPESVHVRSVSHPGQAEVLEQNYRYDLLSPENLLKKYVGKSVRVYRYNEQLGRDEVKTAQVLAAEKGVVLKVDGQITSGTDLGRLAFPEIPNNLVSQPTLEWLLDSGTPRQQLEVSYLSGGLNWHADYVLSLDGDGARGELASWVTLTNESGVGFENADLKLVAGQVNRLAPPREEDADDYKENATLADTQGLREEALSEYHLYRLDRPTTLRHKERKQVSLFGTARVGVQKKLVFTANMPRLLIASTMPAERKPLEHARVVLELQNSQQNGLGMALPQGILRAYTRDAAGAAQFIGEDEIEHTPRDETLSVSVGEAFDVVLERVALKRSQVSRCTLETDWRLDIKNHKDSPETVELRENTGGTDYELVSTSLPPKRQTRDQFSYVLSVPARGATRVEYRIRVRSC
ncbi:MAG TPA: DUF4139 domain-containing protein [Polyangiaceae bacterium]|nr:DUF4139 domain-containing protein [Polyangiaceae bacterium]